VLTTEIDAKYDLGTLLHSSNLKSEIDSRYTQELKTKKRTNRFTYSVGTLPYIMLSGKTSPLDEAQGVIAGTTINCPKSIYCVNPQCDGLAIAFLKEPMKILSGQLILI